MQLIVQLAVTQIAKEVAIQHVLQLVTPIAKVVAVALVTLIVLVGLHQTHKPLKTFVDFHNTKY